MPKEIPPPLTDAELETKRKATEASQKAHEARVADARPYTMVLESLTRTTGFSPEDTKAFESATNNVGLLLYEILTTEYSFMEQLALLKDKTIFDGTASSKTSDNLNAGKLAPTLKDLSPQERIEIEQLQQLAEKLHQHSETFAKRYREIFLDTPQLSALNKFERVWALFDETFNKNNESNLLKQKTDYATDVVNYTALYKRNQKFLASFPQLYLKVPKQNGMYNVRATQFNLDQLTMVAPQRIQRYELLIKGMVGFLKDAEDKAKGAPITPQPPITAVTKKIGTFFKSLANPVASLSGLYYGSDRADSAPDTSPTQKNLNLVTKSTSELQSNLVKIIKSLEDNIEGTRYLRLKNSYPEYFLGKPELLFVDYTENTISKDLKNLLKSLTHQLEKKNSNSRLKSEDLILHYVNLRNAFDRQVRMVKLNALPQPHNPTVEKELTNLRTLNETSASGLNESLKAAHEIMTHSHLKQEARRHNLSDSKDPAKSLETSLDSTSSDRRVILESNHLSALWKLNDYYKLLRPKPNPSARINLHELDAAMKYLIDLDKLITQAEVLNGPFNQVSNASPVLQSLKKMLESRELEQHLRTYDSWLSSIDDLTIEGKTFEDHKLFDNNQHLEAGHKQKILAHNFNTARKETLTLMAQLRINKNVILSSELQASLASYPSTNSTPSQGAVSPVSEQALAPDARSQHDELSQTSSNNSDFPDTDTDSDLANSSDEERVDVEAIPSSVEKILRSKTVKKSPILPPLTKPTLDNFKLKSTVIAPIDGSPNESLADAPKPGSVSPPPVPQRVKQAQVQNRDPLPSNPLTKEAASINNSSQVDGLANAASTDASMSVIQVNEYMNSGLDDSASSSQASSSISEMSSQSSAQTEQEALDQVRESNDAQAATPANVADAPSSNRTGTVGAPAAKNTNTEPAIPNIPPPPVASSTLGSAPSTGNASSFDEAPTSSQSADINRATYLNNNPDIKASALAGNGRIDAYTAGGDSATTQALGSITSSDSSSSRPSDTNQANRKPPPPPPHIVKRQTGADINNNGSIQSVQPNENSQTNAAIEPISEKNGTTQTNVLPASPQVTSSSSTNDRRLPPIPPKSKAQSREISPDRATQDSNRLDDSAAAHIASANLTGMPPASSQTDLPPTPSVSSIEDSRQSTQHRSRISSPPPLPSNYKPKSKTTDGQGDKQNGIKQTIKEMENFFGGANAQRDTTGVSHSQSSNDTVSTNTPNSDNGMPPPSAQSNSNEVPLAPPFTSSTRHPNQAPAGNRRSPPPPPSPTTTTANNSLSSPPATDSANSKPSLGMPPATSQTDLPPTPSMSPIKDSSQSTQSRLRSNSPPPIPSNHKHKSKPAEGSSEKQNSFGDNKNKLENFFRGANPQRDTTGGTNALSSNVTVSTNQTNSNGVIPQNNSNEIPQAPSLKPLTPNQSPAGSGGSPPPSPPQTSTTANNGTSSRRLATQKLEGSATGKPSSGNASPPPLPSHSPLGDPDTNSSHPSGFLTLKGTRRDAITNSGQNLPPARSASPPPIPHNPPNRQQAGQNPPPPTSLPGLAGYRNQQAAVGKPAKKARADASDAGIRDRTPNKKPITMSALSRSSALGRSLVPNGTQRIDRPGSQADPEHNTNQAHRHASFHTESSLNLNDIEDYYTDKKVAFQPLKRSQGIRLIERQVDIEQLGSDITVISAPMSQQTSRVDTMYETMLELSEALRLKSPNEQMSCEIDGFSDYETEKLMILFLSEDRPLSNIIPQLSQASRQTLSESKNRMQFIELIAGFDEKYPPQNSGASYDHPTAG